jgi:hypothetical protein
MKRNEIINLLTDVQSGKVTKTEIRKAVETDHEKLIRRNPSAIRAMELAEMLEPDFTRERFSRFAKINHANRKLYGHDITKWPDKALDEGLALFNGNPVYERLHKCYNEAGYQEFIKWAVNELKLKSNEKN